MIEAPKPSALSHGPALTIDPGALYTTAQVRRLLGNKSPVTIWRWEHDERLGPVVRINGRKHFYGRSIIALIAAGQ
jgi:hypothetical protein